MKHLLPASALAGATLLLALAPRADSVSFHPAAGSSLPKKFTLSLEFELGDVTMIADGNDMSDNIPGDVTGAAEMEMSITDKYVELKDGKPTELIRTFDQLSSNWDASAGGEQAPGGEIENFDALASKSVRFKWNEEKGDYEVNFHESEGDAELLKSLDVDMDLRALLPTKEVSEGDTWEVSGSRLAPLLFCGSKVDAGQMPKDNPIAQLIEDEILPQLEKLGKEFKLTCQYKGTRDEGGSSVGVIGLKLTGEGTLDFKSLIEAAISMQAPEGMDFEATVDEAGLSIKLEGQGECLWDLKAGHMRAFALDSSATCNGRADIKVEVQGESHSAEGEAEILGKIHWKANQAD
jgi:hypothetical protein